MKLYLWSLAVLAAVQWVAAQPAQVIVIRHAEKPLDPNALHLSKEGEKRAKDLVPFLTSEPELIKDGLPVALFATHVTKNGHGQRPQETIAPLSKELHVPIQTPFLSENYEGLAKLILSNPKFKGKTVLICWTHEAIPQLTAALGVHPQPPPWKSDVYDRVFSITYHEGKAILKDLPQRLSLKSPKHKKHAALPETPKNGSERLCGCEET